MKLNDAKNIMLGSKLVNRIYAKGEKVWERAGLSPDDWIYEIDNDEIRILGYKGSGTNITMPSTIEGCPVTIIGSGQSYSPITGIGNILELVISDSVRTISNYAFYSQAGAINKIKRVTIGNGVQTIGASAFQNCYYLEYISIGNSVKEIGESAFYSAGSNSAIGNTVLILGENIEKISGWVFSHCYNIKNLILPDKLKQIAICAFEHCNNITEVVIPDSVESIGDYAFSACTEIKKLTLNNTITSINDAVFESCWSLKEVYFPPQVATIGKRAFSGSGLTTVYMSESCTYFYDANKTSDNSFPYGVNIIRY